MIFFASSRVGPVPVPALVRMRNRDDHITLREKKKQTGIRQRPVEEQVRRRVRAREQRVVHQRGEG